MKYSIKADAVTNINSDCVVVLIWSTGGLTEEAATIDAAGGRIISKLKKSGDFQGKLGETTLLHGTSGLSAKRVLLVGGGEKAKFDAKAAIKLLQAVYKNTQSQPSSTVHLALASVVLTDRDGCWFTSRIAQQGEESYYRYTLTKSQPAKTPATKSVSVSPMADSNRKDLENALKSGLAIGLGINIARELGNLPGNICTPTYLAEQAKSLADKKPGITTQILSEKQMLKLGMGSLLSVSAGSPQEAKMIIMQYKGAKADSKPYVLVGKGITFDTGGVSLKPGLAMDEMKFDMCGAASVLGTMSAVADMKLPINVIGMVAAAENAISGKATKPGDIVTSMSGKTIEILNTDAEGRLVLCDALTYAERFKPRSVIDIATLTGAAVATFGSHVNALLSNNRELAQKLLDYGQTCVDRAWELPLWDEYQSQLDSNFADMQNIGGPRGGTITAACFLARFTESYPWAHLDIAGSAWHSGIEKGATGRPVALLVEYLRNQKA
jgi:leucyl aminopeptidase